MSHTENPTLAGLLRSATVTEREAATLRAALHCWQNELSYFTREELQEYYPDLQGATPLSIGDVDNWENDDFEVTVTATDPGYSVMALGIFVMDNKRESGETLRVYGENDLFLQEFTSGILPHYGSGFMGVISAVPLTRFYFNEHSGGDDVCTKDFHFGVASQ